MNAKRGYGWGYVRRCVRLAALLLAGSLVCSAAWGHVAFTAPAPGTELVAGSTVELTWVDTITHQTTAYRLDFFSAQDSPSVPVAADIPASQHSWSWQVPAQPCSACSLLVTQQNVDSEYSGSLPLVIVAGSNTSASGSASPPQASGAEAGCAVRPTGPAFPGGARWAVWLGVGLIGLARRWVRSPRRHRG